MKPARPLLSTALLQAIGACLLGVAAVATAAPFQPSETAREAFDAAKEHGAERDWRSARVELLNAVAAEPEWADARIALATAALQLFDPVTALEQLTKLQQLDVPPSRFAHLLAHAQWMSGDAAKAIETLQGQNIDREHAAYALRILGRAQMDVGDTQAASATFDRALQFAPEDSLVWTEIGRLRIVIANQGGAIEALDKAVAIDPANVRALELRGRLVRSQFGLAAALPWFERGLQIDPNDVPLLEEYGTTLGDLGRYRDMLATARKIITLDSRNAKAFYMQATLAARAGQFQLARELAEKVSGGFAELPGPQLLIAVCEYELGNFNQAIEILTRLSERQPYNQTVRLLLARSLFRSGDMDAAFGLAVTLPSEAYSDRLLGRILEARGERGEAAAYLDRAFYARALMGGVVAETASPAAAADDAGRNPKVAAAVIPHIRHLLAAERYAEARNAASALVAGNDGVAEAQLLGGDVAWLAGDQNGALAYYENARRLQFSRATMQRLVAAYRATGQGEKASALIAEYAGYNPSDPVAMRLLGFDLMDRRDWNNALPWLLRARAKIGWNDAALNANIAKTLSELGRDTEALRMARLAYRIDPASLVTTRIYGNMLVKTKSDPKAAMDVLRKASKLAPGDRVIAEEYRAARKLAS